MKPHSPSRRGLAPFPGADSGSLSRLAFLLGIAVLAAGCGPKPPADSPSALAVPVRTTVVRSASLADASEYLATLKSRQSSVLNPQVEGQVTHIFVKSGDRVAAGAALMQIDPLKQQATVGSLEAAHAAQAANVQFAQIQWERTKRLFDAGVVSKQEFDQAQTSLDTAQQQLKSLEAQVHEQQVQLHYYRVVAPADGMVGDIPVRVGDRVTTSTLLTTVDEPGSLELYVNVPVERMKDLKRGLAVQLLDPAGKVVAESRIDFISPEVDNNTQSVLAKATVKNSSRALRTSQFARARVIWGARPGRVVPVLAVSRINGQFFAFVVDGQGKSLVAHQRRVQLGELADNQYPVLEGLQDGDRVVIEGAQNLADGASVTEMPADAGGKPSS
jgi:RND family efflux transporter MFP subunit